MSIDTERRGKTLPVGNVEEAIGALYVMLYRLRQDGEYQEEYDVMGTIINLLSVDRSDMRRKYPELKI